MERECPAKSAKPLGCNGSPVSKAAPYGQALNRSCHNIVQMGKERYAKSIPQSELDSFWHMTTAVVLADGPQAAFVSAVNGSASSNAAS
jgi:hypothetical protein